MSPPAQPSKRDEPPLIKTPALLRQLVEGVAVRTCSCPLRHCATWDSVAEGDWPITHLSRVATLRDPAIDEPTFTEHHPGGTRYASPDAPVAISFFPFNRCDVWKCTRCEQHWLRYTEYGGYYVDHRSRRFDAGQVTDAPLPD